MQARLENIPLFLVLSGVFSVLMLVPSAHALAREDHHIAQSFFYAAVLGLVFLGVMIITLSGAPMRAGREMSNLVSLVLGLLVLPFYLALPFYDALGTTSYVNASFEMVSSVTTTGMSLFDPDRLAPSLHLWRAIVGWAGGILMWVAAAAILAPLRLGGFELYETGETMPIASGDGTFQRASAMRRLRQFAQDLVPLYVFLTVILWVMLLSAGQNAFDAAIYAMSTLATSGISANGGWHEGTPSVMAEMFLFLFMGLALSRMTFAKESMTMRRLDFLQDREFRSGLILVVTVPLLLFFRHWIAAGEVMEQTNLAAALHALWGALFTVMSFLTTTGFVSADWNASQNWSGLDTSGLILMGLAVLGGGVATTAGGVKLLRVYALFLHGKRELRLLVHPSSVGRVSAQNRKFHRDGPFMAWLFFMLFALSMASVTVLLALLGVSFEEALTLSIAALSTTGPLVNWVSQTPIDLAALDGAVKWVLMATMVLGRLETLAIIAVLNPDYWRG